jgi:TetR/AcrR family transcriptional regulator, cholesterol catabolism regulator
MTRPANQKAPQAKRPKETTESSGARARTRALSDKSGGELLGILNGEPSGKGTERKYTRRYLEVLTAAARQFSVKGYHSATTKHIADELGVQQGSLYYYIKSKEAALEQICEVAIEGYVTFSVRVRNSRKPASEKIARLVQLHLQTLEERPSFFKVFQENRKDLGDEARHKIGRQIREYEKNVEALFRQGVRTGEFRVDLNTLHAALTLLGACNSVAVWWQVRSSAPVAEIASEITEMLLAGVTSRPQGKA